MSTEPKFLDRPLTPAERSYKYHYDARVNKAADQLLGLLKNPPVGKTKVRLTKGMQENLERLIMLTPQDHVEGKVRRVRTMKLPC